MTVVATYPKLAHDWLAHELDPQLHRKAGTVKSGAGALLTGTVLARIDVGAATAAAKAGGNTGDGAFTLDATNPVRPGAMVGDYLVTCIAAAGNGGTFRVENPNGDVIGDVAVGATFDDDIKFSIADGANDFIVGDAFVVTVAAGSGKWLPISFAANVADGSQNAAGILLNGCDATSADVETAILTGQAQIVPSQLIWPAGATTGQKNAALAQLAALGIVDHQRY